MTKIEHQLSNIVSKIIKASENMDFEDLKSQMFRILEHWWSRVYFLKLLQKVTFFFITWLFYNTIAFNTSIVSYSADRRNFPQCAQVLKFSNVPNVYKMYTSWLILFDSNKLWNLKFTKKFKWIFHICLFQRHGFSRMIRPVHLKYCLPRWDMVSPTLTKHEILSSKVNINN